MAFATLLPEPVPVVQANPGAPDNPITLDDSGSRSAGAEADETMASLASLEIAGPSTTLASELTSTLDEGKVSAGLQRAADLLRESASAADDPTTPPAAISPISSPAPSDPVPPPPPQIF